jgi:ABC-2 type transport system ATP-binding protein
VLVSTHYMDEAERCHDIAYIVYGKLIARGTWQEVVQRSGLITLLGEGPGVDRLSAELARKPGVLTATPFGTSIHVSGEDRAVLEAAIAPYRREPYRWREVDPTLEDVFIRMMGQAEDNFA